METVIKVEGMMCGHCEAAVKAALEAIEEVAFAEVDYQTGMAVVTLEENVSDDILKAAVEAEDYTALSVTSGEEA